VLSGEVVDFGPDNEPLLVNVRPIAWLTAELVADADRRYRHRMNVGQG
jgi:hypothetical protein